MKGIDFEAHYSVDGYKGIAFFLAGYEQTWEPYTCLVTDPDTGEEYEEPIDEGEWVDNTDAVRAIMVGDDRVHIVDVDDLTIIEEDSFCRECGQVGCGHNVYV